METPIWLPDIIENCSRMESSDMLVAPAAGFASKAALSLELWEVAWEVESACTWGWVIGPPGGRSLGDGGHLVSLEPSGCWLLLVGDGAIPIYSSNGDMEVLETVAAAVLFVIELVGVEPGGMLG